MDFIQRYQHRMRRLLSKGSLAIGLPASPSSMVVDVRRNKSIESYIYDSMVAILEQTPSVDVIFLIDHSTHLTSFTSLMRFAHRLDCAITIRSEDVFLDIPEELVKDYIYCVTKWSEDHRDHHSFIPKKYCLEIEYNENTCTFLDEIIAANETADKHRLVLPEYAKSLPIDDEVLQDWVRYNGVDALYVGFMSGLKELRTGFVDDQPGYPSSKRCRIDELYTYIDREYKACPHKSMGVNHIQEIRNCSRMCTSMMLRMPDIREFFDVSNRIQRKRK